VKDGLAELEAELIDEAMGGVDLNAPFQASLAL